MKKKNDNINNNICYKKCPFNYYYDSNNQYQCTDDTNCPNIYNKFVEEKKRCIDDCKKDNIYKYQYNNTCLLKCPKNSTISKNDSFICEPCDGSCDSNPISETVDALIDDYSTKNSSCDNNYETEDENEQQYFVFIYKKNECQDDTDFGDCYNTIKQINNLTEDLIISKVYIDHTSIYSFYHPYTFAKLDTTPCKDQKITVQEDIKKKLNEQIEDSKEKLILNLIDQGINVFNISDEFYRNLCYHYVSPNGKDVPIKVRLSAFFPNNNITLCDKGCENVGVDIAAMRAKCECKFVDLVNIDLIKDNTYARTIKEIFNIISELNIAVVKCYKDIFKKEYFFKNTGGFIILTLFIGQVGCFVQYIIDGLYFIRKYIFDLTNSYMIYLNDINHLNNPPPKHKKKSKKFWEKENLLANQNKNSITNKATNKLLILDTNERKYSSSNCSNNLTNKNMINNHSNKQNTSKNMLFINMNNTNKEKDHCIFNMKEYLSYTFDENDFYDVLDKDKRTFIAYFCEKFKNNQIFINTFFIKEKFRPRSLKILVLIMTIELYFVINAIFYNEDYLADLFYSEEEEKFYSFITRRVDEYIYTSAVSGIISYFVSYVFIDEEKIKKIFRRNKEGDLKMKYELSVIVKNIETKFKTIIIFSLCLTIICFVYISCFNNVYPYIKNEWIKSSIFILLLMQVINFLFTSLECILRYSAIKCNSEKIFRLSQIFTL